MTVAIGIKESGLNPIADELTKLLADTYTLYLKTQNFHWNVKGVLFYSLHLLFEKQYEELADAVDLIAERIRALGFHTPASFNEFSKLTRIKEAGNSLTAESMIQQLLQDHESITRTCHDMMKIAQDSGDEATADLLIERMREHDKTAWMLRSSHHEK
jgi:starvation-inducible DNA-binding protein